MFKKPGVIIAALLSAVYLSISVATLSDYGVGWDVSEMFVGDRNLAFYLTLDPDYLNYGKPMPIPEYGRPDHPDFEQVLRAEKIQFAIFAPHHIWPVGAVSASITNKIFYSRLGWMGAIESRHFAAVLWLWLLLMTVFSFLWYNAGPWEAVLATIALATFPRIVAHGHFNLKDIPSCASFTLVVLTFYRGVQRRSWVWIVISSVVWGIGLAVKANLLFVPLILIPWYVIDEVHRRRDAGGVPRGRVLAALLGYPFVAVVIALICWPYLLVDFPDHLKTYLTSLVRRGYSGDAGWQTGPFVTWITTMPLVDIVLSSIGVFVLRQRRSEPLLQGFGSLLALWIGVTLVRVSVPGAIDFDGIRHWMEIVPAVCILVGFGGARLIRLVEDRALKDCEARTRLVISAALVAVVFAPTVMWSVHNHPHQIAYYNQLIGRLPGAQAAGLTDSTDYWGVSTRSAMRWFNENAELGAAIVPLIAAHNIDYTKKVWLRDDLKLIATNALNPAAIRTMLKNHRGPVYVCYITRTDFYDDRVRYCEARLEPIAEFLVDGAPIYKIFRVDGEILANMFDESN
jgi:hypothetical protein